MNDMTFGPLILKLHDRGVVELELPALGCSLTIKPITKCPTLPPDPAIIETTGIELPSNLIAFPTRAA